jgi:hypothetical protein
LSNSGVQLRQDCYLPLLASVGREHEISSLSEVDDALSLLAGHQAGELRQIADEMSGRSIGGARRERSS